MDLDKFWDMLFDEWIEPMLTSLLFIVAILVAVPLMVICLPFFLGKKLFDKVVQ